MEQRKGEASSRQSQSAVQQALMAAQANGSIRGIHGRLGVPIAGSACMSSCRAMNIDAIAGDLGAIDAKYDVAVSTASPQLDFVVVDSTAVAQQCIELLRKQGLGVATFLMLDKQQHLAAQAAQPVQPPEGRAQVASLQSAALCHADLRQRCMQVWPGSLTWSESKTRS